MESVFIVVSFGRVIMSAHATREAAESRMYDLRHETHDHDGYWVEQHEVRS